MAISCVTKREADHAAVRTQFVVVPPDDDVPEDTSVVWHCVCAYVTRIFFGGWDMHASTLLAPNIVPCGSQNMFSP